MVLDPFRPIVHLWMVRSADFFDLERETIPMTRPKLSSAGGHPCNALRCGRAIRVHCPHFCDLRLRNHRLCSSRIDRLCADVLRTSSLCRVRLFHNQPRYSSSTKTGLSILGTKATSKLRIGSSSTKRAISPSVAFRYDNLFDVPHMDDN